MRGLVIPEGFWLTLRAQADFPLTLPLGNITPADFAFKSTLEKLAA